MQNNVFLGLVFVHPRTGSCKAGFTQVRVKSIFAQGRICVAGFFVVLGFLIFFSSVDISFKMGVKCS